MPFNELCGLKGNRLWIVNVIGNNIARPLFKDVMIMNNKLEKTRSP